MSRTISLFVVLFAVLCVTTAFADGMLIPGIPGNIIPDEPYFTVKYHHVKTEIRDQLCTTYIDQVFVNPGRREMEATYIFPLPKGAVVRDFTLHADGQELKAELLDKEKAQKIYEDIVRRRKDPALLTYAGEGAYQCKIYPIPPGGQRRIEIRYSELLTYDSGVIGYTYPLSPEQFSHDPIESVVFTADIEAQNPIGTVYSPSHDIVVSKISKNHVRVSYEENGTRPDRDILLYYNVAADPVGLSLVTFKEPGQDGFFLLLAAPTVEQQTDKVVPKNISFVLDTSGSMSGEKIEQAKEALTFCINSLNQQDHFNIVTFSGDVRPFDEKLLPASPENTKKARDFVAGFQAGGGTDIDSALRTALQKRARDEANYIVFLTDGEATVGETDNAKIITNVASEAAKMQGATRLFVFGVGYDVNTNLLDRLAQDNGGLTTYVRPTENIEVKVSSFFSKIARPLLTDINIAYGAAEIYDTFPRELPDLFSGSQLEIFGRYKDASAGQTTIILNGTTAEGSQTYELACRFPEKSVGGDHIASLWASRKIGYLLDQIRLHGENKELVDEIVRLSLEYGILTEYTAFLANEDAPLAVDEIRTLAGKTMNDSFTYSAGAGATSRAQNAQAMQQQKAVSATNTFVDAEGNMQRIANVQNIGQRGYIQRNGRWEDTRWQQDQKIVMRIQAYSEAYFQLSRNFPAANSQLAVGDNAILILNGQVIEIADEGKTVLTDEDLKLLGTAAPVPEQASLPLSPAFAGAMVLLVALGIPALARRRNG